MATNGRSPAINSARLRALFDDVSAFGRSAGSDRVDRMAFSDADMEARRWLARQMEEAGLSVRWDGAGNVIGRWGDPQAEAVMAGSHLDSAPGGGAFEGVLGVCVALECVRAMRDAALEPAIPVEVAATVGGGRFGTVLGAGAMAGTFDGEWVAKAADTDGVRLADAMAGQGLDASAIAGAARPAGSLKAFLELNVEQGPVLEANGQTVGIVEADSGFCIWRVTLTGVAHHSGTAPMEMRSDAFAGLAEIAATIPSIIRIVGGPSSRVTIGKVDLSPNDEQVVPGRATFSLIIRDTSDKVIKALTAALRALIDRVAKSRILDAAIEEAGSLQPVTLDTGLAQTIEREAKRLDLAFMRMTSGIRHDAEVMQALCPSALIFVPSRTAAGEVPQEEQTAWSDIEQAATLYLEVLCRLCHAGEAVAAAASEPQDEKADAVDSPREGDAAGQDEGTEVDDLDFDFELDEIALREED